MKRLIGLSALALMACGPDATMPLKGVAPHLEPPENPRVTVTRIGIFQDGLAYGDARGVYLIEDRATGKEFIGISGVGIAETGDHSNGKTRCPDER